MSAVPRDQGDAAFAGSFGAFFAEARRASLGRGKPSNHGEIARYRGVAVYSPPLKRRVGLQRQLQAGSAGFQLVVARSRTMKQRLAMLLLLFLGGAFVQTAAAALSPAQALEAMHEFAGADTNGDGFLEPDEIMALDEVRAQPAAAAVEPRVRPVARARVSGSGSGFRRPKRHWSRMPVLSQCRHVSRCAAALASKQLRATARPVVVTS